MWSVVWRNDEVMDGWKEVCRWEERACEREKGRKANQQPTRKTRDKTKSRCDKSRISIITLTSRRNKKQTDAESVRIRIRKVIHVIRRKWVSP